MTVLLISMRDGTVKRRVDLRGRRKLTVGRSPRCDLRLVAKNVSRRHALLFEHEGQWHLVDIGSRCGVFKGPDQVQHVVLEPSAWARIGPAYLWITDKRRDEGNGLRLDGFDPLLSREVGLSTGDPEASGDGGRPGGPALVVIDAAASALERFELGERDLLTVGRSPSCDIQLHDPAVSRLHAVVYREHAGWCVANAAPSSRATRVGSRPTWRRRLSDDLVVRLGHSLFWLERSDAGEEDGVDDTSFGTATAAAASPTPPAEPMRAESAFFDDPAEDLMDAAAEPDPAMPDPDEIPCAHTPSSQDEGDGGDTDDTATGGPGLEEPYANGRHEVVSAFGDLSPLDPAPGARTADDPEDGPREPIQPGSPTHPRPPDA